MHDQPVGAVAAEPDGLVQHGRRVRREQIDLVVEPRLLTVVERPGEGVRRRTVGPGEGTGLRECGRELEHRAVRPGRLHRGGHHPGLVVDAPDRVRPPPERHTDQRRIRYVVAGADPELEDDERQRRAAAGGVEGVELGLHRARADHVRGRDDRFPRFERAPGLPQELPQGERADVAVDVHGRVEEACGDAGPTVDRMDRVPPQDGVEPAGERLGVLFQERPDPLRQSLADFRHRDPGQGEHEVLRQCVSRFLREGGDGGVGVHERRVALDRGGLGRQRPIRAASRRRAAAHVLAEPGGDVGAEHHGLVEPPAIRGDIGGDIGQHRVLRDLLEQGGQPEHRYADGLLGVGVRPGDTGADLDVSTIVDPESGLARKDLAQGLPRAGVTQQPHNMVDLAPDLGGTRPPLLAPQHPGGLTHQLGDRPVASVVTDDPHVPADDLDMGIAERHVVQLQLGALGTPATPRLLEWPQTVVLGIGTRQTGRDPVLARSPGEHGPDLTQPRPLPQMIHQLVQLTTVRELRQTRPRVGPQHRRTHRRPLVVQQHRGVHEPVPRPVRRGVRGGRRDLVSRSLTDRQLGTGHRPPAAHDRVRPRRQGVLDVERQHRARERTGRGVGQARRRVPGFVRCRSRLGRPVPRHEGRRTVGRGRSPVVVRTEPGRGDLLAQEDDGLTRVVDQQVAQLRRVPREPRRHRRGTTPRPGGPRPAPRAAPAARRPRRTTGHRAGSPSAGAAP